MGGEKYFYLMKLNLMRIFMSGIDGVKLLLIANKNGLSYFMHVFDPELDHMDDTMLTGLINALIMFSEATIQDKIQSAQFAKVSIKFQIHDELLFILIISHDMNQEVVSDIIKSIRIRFLEKYGENLNNNAMDYSIFEDFNKEVEKILQLDRYVLEEFRGYHLYKPELDFLLELERIGEKVLRIVPILKPQENGIVLNKNHIVGINSFMRNLRFIPETIENLEYLEDLILDRNKIKKFNLGIGKLSNLKDMSVQNNQLTELPPNFTNLTSLEQVNFSWNRIEKLPEDIGKFKNLKKLNLSWNKITEIPKSKEKLENLQELNLSYNKIQNLPFIFENLPKIQILNFEGNKINTISENLENKGDIDQFFTNLNLEITEINLKANRIQNLPRYFGYFTTLTHLNLESNHLNDLPIGIINLQNLEYINLRGNPLRELSSEVSNWLEVLKMQRCKVVL